MDSAISPVERLNAYVALVDKLNAIIRHTDAALTEIAAMEAPPGTDERTLAARLHDMQRAIERGELIAGQLRREYDREVQLLRRQVAP